MRLLKHKRTLTSLSVVIFMGVLSPVPVSGEEGGGPQISIPPALPVPTSPEVTTPPVPPTVPPAPTPTTPGVPAPVRPPGASTTVPPVPAVTRPDGSSPVGSDGGTNNEEGDGGDGGDGGSEVRQPLLPPNPELDFLRDRRVSSSDELWALRYSDEELAIWEAALVELLEEKEQKVQELDEQLEKAQAEVNRLTRVIKDINREIDVLEQTVKDRVVEAYMVLGTTSSYGSALLMTDNPSDFEFKKFLVDLANASDEEIVGRLSERKAAVGDEKKRAEEKREEVNQLKSVADSELEEVDSIKEDVESLRAALAVRGADVRREIDALAAEESALRRLLGYPEEVAGVSAPRNVERPASSRGLIWPVNGVLTSVFGMRWGALHAGIDIGAPTGTPIYATNDGTVIFSGVQGGYGNIVIIDHGDGFHTAYAHMSRLVAVNGSRVLRGELIGLVGSTGNSTGPHLHFETRVQGRAYDPLQYLP